MRFRNKSLITYIIILYVTLFALGWSALKIIIKQIKSGTEIMMRVESEKIVDFLSAQEEKIELFSNLLKNSWNSYGEIPEFHQKIPFFIRLEQKNTSLPEESLKDNKVIWDVKETKEFIYLVLTIKSNLLHPVTGKQYSLEIKQEIFLHLSEWIKDMSCSNILVFSSDGKFLCSFNKAESKYFKKKFDQNENNIFLSTQDLTSIRTTNASLEKYVDINGPVLLYFFPYPEDKMRKTFIFGLEYPMGMRNKILRLYGMLTIGILSAVTLILASMYYFVTLKINNYFHQLINFTKRVAKGDFFLRLDVNAKSDFSGINDSLNQMASSLEEMKAYEQRFLVLDRLSSLAQLSEGIAHEIKNPLMVLKFSVNDIEKHIDDKKFQEDLDMMSKNIDRIESVVLRLAHFSRPSESEQKENCDLISILEETLYFLKKNFDNKNIIVVNNICCEKIYAAVKKNAIFQVFTNVLLNAMEAIVKDGTITIDVSIKNKGTNEQFAIFAIQDTGEGIPAKNHSKIFNPFFTTKDKGTGLGLAIVYSIMSEHNGFIEIAAESKDKVIEDEGSDECAKSCPSITESENIEGTTILLGFSITSVEN